MSKTTYTTQPPTSTDAVPAPPIPSNPPAGSVGTGQNTNNNSTPASTGERITAAVENAVDWYKTPRPGARFNWRKTHPVWNAGALLAAWKLPLPFLWAVVDSVTQAAAQLHPGASVQLPAYGSGTGWMPAAVQVPLMALNIYINPQAALVALILTSLTFGALGAAFGMIWHFRVLRQLKLLTNVTADAVTRAKHAEKLRRPGLVRNTLKFAGAMLAWAVITGLWQFTPFTEAVFGPLRWGA